jgi:hypothetical protein
MASNLNTVMTYAQAVETFTEDIIPMLIEQETEDQGGQWQQVDSVFRWNEWINWTDFLCKDGQISDWQYENWPQPDCCGD